MINLLTGKTQDATHPEPAHNKIVEDSWTAEAYLAAMRRNLYAAGKPGADTASLLLAANTLALAAQAAWPGPATTAESPKTDTSPSRVRINTGQPPATTLPRDGDAL